jgi:hypothetical protein
MTTVTKEVCIVGNGPNAYLAARVLLEHGIKVTLIDSHRDTSAGTSLFKKFVLKKREQKGDLYAQGIPIASKTKGSVMPIETRRAGGLTNLWGGMFFPPYLPYYKEKFSIDNLDFEEAVRYFSENLFFERSGAQNWNELVTKELLLTEDKVIHLTPQIALNEKGDIWNSNSLFEQLSHKNLTRINGTLVRISPNKDNLILRIRLDNSFNEFESNNLLLASGPIGNAKIIANSMGDSGKINLADSGVSYHLTISLKSQPHIQNEMRSEKCGFYFRNGSLRGYYQHYYFSKELIGSIKYPIVRSLARIANTLSGDRLGLVMIFRNDIDSNFIEITKSKEMLHLAERRRSNVKNNLGIFWNISKSIFFKGIIVLPLFLRGGAGEGAHTAGPNLDELKKANPGEALLEELGNRIHLLGMSCDDRVLAGPVTYLSFVLTLRKLEALLSDG